MWLPKPIWITHKKTQNRNLWAITSLIADKRFFRDKYRTSTNLKPIKIKPIHLLCHQDQLNSLQDKPIWQFNFKNKNLAVPDPIRGVSRRVWYKFLTKLKNLQDGPLKAAKRRANRNQNLLQRPKIVSIRWLKLNFSNVLQKHKTKSLLKKPNLLSLPSLRRTQIVDCSRL